MPEVGPELLGSRAGGLVWFGGGYRVVSEGEAVFDGERPEGCVHCGPEAAVHAHGFFGRWLWTLKSMLPVRLRVRLRRWQCQECERTTSSRPADIMPNGRLCTALSSLVVWFAIREGREKCLDRFPGQEEPLADSRTVARWLDRARRNADHTEQFIRLAVIERSEPRPLESMFPGGLSPPDDLLRRPWRSPSLVASLWRGLSLMWRCSIELDVPLCRLLAWARGRADALGKPFLTS